MSNIIAYLPTEVLSEDGKIIKLRHPKANKQFLVYYTPKSCFELLAKKEKHASWFVDDSVVSSNQLIIATPLDPYFVILPYLLQCPAHFRPISQILVDSDFPSISYVETLLTEAGLSRICEIRKPTDDILVKFDKSKALEWLCVKVKNVIREMKNADIQPGFNSHLSEDEYLRYSCGIIADYLPPVLSRDLHEKLGLQIVEAEEISEKPVKRQKTNPEKENVKSTLTVKTKDKVPKQSKAQKKLAAVNTKGMKSMTTFFSKK